MIKLINKLNKINKYFLGLGIYLNILIKKYKND